MAMNVAAMNNMATKAANVGYIPNQKLNEVKKEEQVSTQVQELDEQDTENGAGKADQDTRGSQNAAETRNQQAAQQARRRQISQPQTQTRSTTSESTEAATAEQAGPGQGTEGGPKPRVLLDNTARMNWEFQANQKSQASEGETPQTSPQVQKRQFLTRLKGMVDLEYQQYVKSDTALYSRRNLREIMSALGGQEDPNLRKLESEDRSSKETNEAPPGELEGYNKFNQMRAANSLRILHEHQQQPPQDQLSLVA